MNPTVSCIIPVYNGELYIAQAIRSVIAQTAGQVQVIVIDDGSTDGTAAAVREVAPDAVYEYQENAGPAAARNRGVAHATGEFIAFLDSDDAWLPNKLERQIESFVAMPALDCVLAHVRMVWEESLAKEESLYRDDNRTEVAGFAGSTMLVRRSSFDRVGLFRADLPHAATVDWFERAKNIGFIVSTVSEVLVVRRMHENNFSRQGRERSQDEMLELVKRSLDRRRAEARG